MRIIFETLREGLLEHFAVGATNSVYELNHVLLGNNQASRLDKITQRNYPLVYLTLNSNIEWRTLPGRTQVSQVFFNVQLNIESYDEIEDSLHLNRFKQELVKKIRTLSNSNTKYVMNAPYRVSEKRDNNEDNIMKYDILFSCNLYDRSLINNN